MVRLLFIVITPLIALLSGSALAEPQCGGRYGRAQAMLDAAYGKYGTLYSGGFHHRRLDGVGASLDIYRLLKGLPDLNLRNLAQHSFGEGTIDNTIRPWKALDLSEIYKQARDAIAAGDTRPAVLFDYAVSADLITWRGPEPDWFLRPESVFDLGARSRATALLASTDDAIAWLQTIISDRSVTWTFDHRTGTGRASSVQRLAAFAVERYTQDPSAAWEVAAVVPTGVRPAPGPEISGTVLDKIRDCTASETEYVTLVIKYLSRSRTKRIWRDKGNLGNIPELLGPGVRHMLCAQVLVSFVQNQRSHPDTVVQTWLDNHCAEVLRSAWGRAGLGYLAPSAKAFLSLHDQPGEISAYSMRQLNLFSADTMLAFAMNDHRNTETRRAILPVVFGRYIALGLYKEAKRLLVPLADLFPDHAAMIDATDHRLWPLDVRLSLIALEMPSVTEWATKLPAADEIATGLRRLHHSRRSRDMPLAYRTARLVERDVEAWSLARPRSQRAIQRLHDTGGGYVPPINGRLRARPYLPPLLEAIALDELADLGAHTGLSNRISATLVHWIDRRSRTMIRRQLIDNDAMAEILVDVIRLGRRSYSGRIGPVVSGQAAFSLLKRRFPDSDAAQRTRYWYTCRHRCDR